MLMKFFRLLDILQPLMFRCPAVHLSSDSMTALRGCCRGLCHYCSCSITFTRYGCPSLPCPYLSPSSYSDPNPKAPYLCESLRSSQAIPACRK